MTQAELITLIKEVTAALVILGGIIATLAGAVSAYRKNESEIAHKQDEKDKQNVDLTERLQKLSADLLDEMDKRYDKLSEDYKILRAQLVRKDKQITLLRSAGLALMTGIENSLKARETRTTESGEIICGACLMSDSALLKQLLEVRSLFEKETLE